MQTESTNPKWMFWTGCVLSALPVLLMLFSAFAKLSGSEEAVKGFADMGYPADARLWIGIAEVGSTLVYVIPQTAVFGAILLTGYLGGATDVHVRTGQPFWIPVAVGIVIWLGLYFREARLRDLVPLRK
jgi:hypothetical protein